MYVRGARAGLLGSSGSAAKWLSVRRPAASYANTWVVAPARPRVVLTPVRVWVSLVALPARSYG